MKALEDPDFVAAMHEARAMGKVAWEGELTETTRIRLIDIRVHHVYCNKTECACGQIDKWRRWASHVPFIGPWLSEWHT